MAKKPKMKVKEITVSLSKKCLYCNNKFEVKRSRYAERKYCSLQCRRQYETKNKQKTIICYVCGKSFTIPQSKTKGNRGRFCSRKCFHKWHKIQFIGHNNPLWNSQQVNCYVCGAIIYRPYYRIKRSRRFYCSQECQRSVVNNLYGGKAAYTKFHHARRKALERKVGHLSAETIKRVYFNNIQQHKILTCVYCCQPISFSQASIDHVQPLTKAGTHDIENLVIACISCNSRKRNKSKKEFLEILKNTG